MSLAYQDAWLTVLQGDARDELARIPDASIDAVVTSPPYWQQRSYLPADSPLKDREIGREPTFDGWLATMVAICGELRRVLRPEGSLWLVLGDKYVAYGGQRTGKSAGKRGYAHRVPAVRPGLGGFPAGLRRKSLILAPYRLAIALEEDGWILRDRVVWEKTNALPESVGDRLSVRDEVVLRFTLSGRATFDLASIRDPYSAAAVARVQPHRALTFSGRKHEAPGQPPRTPRAPLMGGTKGAAAGVTRLSEKPWNLRAGKNPGNVWRIATAARPGNDYAHFAMFPPELVRRPILATCPRGGVVLDPFAGTGTVGEVANSLLRRAILIELDPASVESIRIRCQARPIVEVPA